MRKFDAMKWWELKTRFILAKTYWECVKDVANEIETEILKTHEFYQCEEMAKLDIRFGGNGKPTRIFDPHEAYQIGPETEAFKRYLELCYDGYKDFEIDDPRGVGYCPDNQARDEYYAAEKALIDYAIDNIPDQQEDQRIDKAVIRQAMRNMKYKEQFLETILKMAV